MRRVLLRTAGLVLAGIAPLLVVEIVLRLVDLQRPGAALLVGFDPSVAIFERVGDQVAVVPRFASTWRAQPFPAEPRPAALRFFAVGDSITWGHQGNEFGTPLAAWPDVLERLLGERVAGGPHRVVNLGARTFGSARVANVVRQALDHRPDAVLVNVGTSEHLERDFAAQLERDRHRPAWLADFRVAWVLESWLAPQSAGLSLAQLRERDGALRASFVRPSSLEGGQADRAALLAQSERNLRAIIAACRERNVPLALATVPANLRFPPFATRFEPPAATEEGEGLIRRAGELLDQRRPEEARALVQSAIAAHPEAAALHYRLGQACDQLGDVAGARAAYEQALETDACPARGLAAFNDLVRRLVRENPGVLLLDQQRLFRDAVPDGIPDDRLFLDNCHPTAAMQARMAEEVYRVIEGAGLSRAGAR